MIKGCQKKIIMVKDTKSKYFDAAYFVLKKDIPQACSSSDILSEANRIIDNCYNFDGIYPQQNIQAEKPSPSQKFKIGWWLFFAFLSVGVFFSLGVLAFAFIF